MSDNLFNNIGSDVVKANLNRNIKQLLAELFLVDTLHL